MSWRRPRLLIAATSILAVVVAASVAWPADNYPIKPIRLIVPVGAGSASDVRARQIGDRLAKALGQPIVIENRPGAGQRTGALYAARSAPDGYTLLYGTVADQALAPALYPDLPYDPGKAFVPIAQNSLIPPILVVNPALGVRDMGELIALAKTKPGRLTFGSWGSGTLSHLLGLQLAREAGIELLHVPYKDAAASLNDVVAGHVDMMFDYTITCRPLIAAGKLKVLMTVGAKRSSVLPDMPSAAELGMPAIRHMGWSAIFAPAGMPPEIVARLNRELVRIVRSPEIMQIIVDSGGDPDAVGGTPESIAAFVKRERESLAALIKASGVRLD